MSLTKFTGNTNVISQLADVPVQTGDDLKAKFDEAETAIKNYLNSTLTTEVDQLVATEKASLQNLISSLSTSTTNSINELNTNKNTMISDGYSNTKAYKIGDLCIYNDTLYRCTTAIDEGEAWNSSHWEQTNLGDEVRKEVYSTEEKVVGTWIDGKPIYRKVISFGALPNDSTKSIVHNILNLKRIVKLEGFAGSNQNLGGITLPHATLTPVALYADSSTVSVKTNNDATAYIETYIYVYYTKTTD